MAERAASPYTVSVVQIGPKRRKSHNPRPRALDTSTETPNDHQQPAIRPNQSKWSTFPKPAGRTASPSSAASTRSTRSPSTRLERPRCSLRESAVTTGSRAVTVVRLSPSSTRRLRPPRRLCSVWSALSARPRLSCL